MSVMLVGIATSADSPPRLRGKVVELDRFSAQVALETREPALRQGASVWLHFDPPGGGSPLSVGGIISGVAPGGGVALFFFFTPPPKTPPPPRSGVQSRSKSGSHRSLGPTPRHRGQPSRRRRRPRGQPWSPTLPA